MTRKKKQRDQPTPKLSQLPPEAREAMLKLRPEPEVLANALEMFAVSGGRRSAFEICMDAYRRFHGLTPAEAASPGHIVQTAALFGRMAALSEVLASDMIDPGSAQGERFEAILEATCSVRLVTGKGPPRFQPLEFMAAVGRIEAELRRESAPIGRT